MLIGILISAGVAVACRIAYVQGFKAGVDTCMEARRNQELGAVCERWKGHVSHRGHVITSPIPPQPEAESEVPNDQA